METGNTELQDFVNAILYVDENRCYDTGYLPEDYLELLTGQTASIRESFKALLLSGEKVGEEARDYSRTINDMYSFWYALHEIMDEGDMKVSDSDGLWYSRGECYIQLSDMYKDSGDNHTIVINCNINLYDSREVSRLMKTLPIKTYVVWTPDETSQDYGLKALQDIQKEIDILWQKQSIDTMIQLLGIFCPEAGATIEFMKSQSEDLSMSDAISKGQKLPVIKDKMNSGAETVFQFMHGVTGYMEDREALEKKKDTEVERNMLAWFYSANEYRIGYGEESWHYISSGIYNYDVIQGIRTWNDMGIGFLLVDEEKTGVTEEELSEIYKEKEGKLYKDLMKATNNFEGYDEEVKNVAAYMVYGNAAKEMVSNYTGEYKSVLEIDGEIFSIIINDLKFAIKDNSANINQGINQIWDNEIVNYKGRN